MGKSNIGFTLLLAVALGACFDSIHSMDDDEDMSDAAVASPLGGDAALIVPVDCPNPMPERCDRLDNDCDGEVDEDGICGMNTPPRAMCPPPQSGATLAFYPLVGGYVDPDGDPMVAARWRIVEAPVGSTAGPEPVDALEASFFADLLGAYSVTLEVEDARGGFGQCTATVRTGSDDGLRIEMVWNIGDMGDHSDVDLHLRSHRSGARWFDAQQDCYYDNCRVCDAPYSMGPVAYERACRALIADYNTDPNREPPPQLTWTAPLGDDDPRLDLDDIEGNGPENIGIRHPRDGTYRLGVHYFDDDGSGGAATVVVRIFCAGALAMAFEPVRLRPGELHTSRDREFWEVADIVWAGERCEVEALGEPGCPAICGESQIRERNACPVGETRGRFCD